MSRTIKGGKGPGHEYWGRCYSKSGNLVQPGRKTKKITNRAERRIARQKATCDV